jgi:hypothetical protein
MLPTKAVLPLLLFILLVFLLGLYALAASGHFPREHRAPTLASRSGLIVLHGSVVIAILSLAAGLGSAWRLIPWYAAVIGGGLAILAAPLGLQQFSDRFVNGRAALLSFATAGGVLAVLLLWLAS